LSLLVNKRGLHTTVQDLGRAGYRAWGVPVGGAFDRRGHELANALAGNGPECATLELTLQGGTFDAEIDLALALAGAAMPARRECPDGSSCPVHVPQSFTLRRGERLVLGTAGTGARAYLAVAGGWRTPEVLGSRSSEIPLLAGARLPAASGRIASRRPAEVLPLIPADHQFRIVAGPDASCLDDDRVLEQAFRVAPQSDRVGLRLDGPPIAVRAPADRLSAPVLPGAVQVAGGRAIVLGVSCGTMGGYPHVAQVITADLDALGQLRPGDTIRFRRVPIEVARALDAESRRRRAALRGLIAAAAHDPFGAVD
jgi:biotin-dependent carboxylase-like uncharacterized protein